MRVLAIDPGGTTGWALWTDEDGPFLGPHGWLYSLEDSVALGTGKWWAGQLEGEELGHASNLVIGMLEGDVVVVEDFVLRPGKHLAYGGDKGRRGLAPVRVTCYLEALVYAEELDVKWVRQQPSAAKGVVTDTRLRDLGLWVRGQGHARDALRHLVLYLRSAKIPIG